MEKECSKCKKNKKLSEFNKFKRSKDGYSYSCKDCNRPLMLKGLKNWRENNRERSREVVNKSYEKNKEKRLDAIKKRSGERKKTDPEFKLKELMRNRVSQAVRCARGSKSATTQELIGCTCEELRKHLESKFTEGMNWDNYGKKGWEVDHIRPCASFNLTDPEQQKECFNYTNLQPLWSKDNGTKSSFYKGKQHKHADHINRTESDLHEEG